MLKLCPKLGAFFEKFITIFLFFLTEDRFLNIFTRCDVVGTWSREYQLSSSSHSYSYSHSHSHSPDDSHFFGFSQVSRNF
jgi:hypothetical protein